MIFSKLARITLILLIAGGITSFASAQSTKKTKPKPKATPAATPMPVLTGAEIISRAEDLSEKPMVVPGQSIQPVAPRDEVESSAAAMQQLADRIKKLEASSRGTTG